MINKRRNKNSKAQTATEFAIFGGILVFVIGLIFRYAVSFNATQNQWLKAVRLAFSSSYLHTLDPNSEGVRGMGTSRNFASILFIEDRKDALASMGKLGSEARAPLVFGSSGTFSKNLLQPSHYGEQTELPTMDVIVNGKYFQFTIAGYRTYCVLPSEDICAQVREELVNPTGEWWMPSVWVTAGWIWVPTACFEVAMSQIPGDGPLMFEKVTYLKTTGEGGHFDPNDIGFIRFDYNRNGMCDNTAYGGLDYKEPCDANGYDRSDRSRMTWQWHPVRITSGNLDIDEGKMVIYDVDGDLKEEAVLRAIDMLGREIDLISRTIDVTGDFLAVASKECRSTAFASTSDMAFLEVLDSQEGDIDFSHNTYDSVGGPTPASGYVERIPVPAPGLQQDQKIYTETHGTYYLLEEGKLYSVDPDDPDSKQYVRDAQRQDRIAVIERIFQLSNDTGRMCEGGINHISRNGPVEACCPTRGCCYGGNTYKTCFDTDNKLLYIRSRVSDKGGRKWITDISKDEMPIEY